MQSKRSSKEDSKVVNFARFMKQNIEIIYKQFCANAASGQIYISWHFEEKLSDWLTSFKNKSFQDLNINIL